MSILIREEIDQLLKITLQFILYTQILNEKYAFFPPTPSEFNRALHAILNLVHQLSN
jgi:hypothetical protein